MTHLAHSLERPGTLQHLLASDTTRLRITTDQLEEHLRRTLVLRRISVVLRRHKLGVQKFSGISYFLSRAIPTSCPLSLPAGATGTHVFFFLLRTRIFWDGFGRAVIMAAYRTLRRRGHGIERISGWHGAGGKCERSLCEIARGRYACFTQQCSCTDL